MKASDPSIIWVTGKGGVGKSTVAAALALRLARSGSNTLLAELGEDSYLGRVLLTPPRSDVSHLPVALETKLSLAQWSGESCLREYVLHYLKIERLYRLFFENRVMRALVNVAPGLPEVAIVGKATSGPRKVGPPMPYDAVVIDSFATGHSLSLWRGPQGMGQAIGIGPMGHHSRQMDAVMRDPKCTQIVIVTLAEELPVQETLELEKAIQGLGLPKPVVVVNRLWDFHLRAAAARASGDFARLVEKQLLRQEEQVQALRTGLGSEVELIELPQIWQPTARPVIEALTQQAALDRWVGGRRGN